MTRYVYALAIAHAADPPSLHHYTPEVLWACWAMFCAAVWQGRAVTCCDLSSGGHAGWHPATGFQFDLLPY